jgi:hypothetical protein
MRGCVGAIDGIAIKILMHSVVADPKNRPYYNQKGFYALNVQQSWMASDDLWIHF